MIYGKFQFKGLLLSLKFLLNAFLLGFSFISLICMPLKTCAKPTSKNHEIILVKVSRFKTPELFCFMPPIHIYSIWINPFKARGSTGEKDLPVRPTFFLHVVHRFFFVFLSSGEEATSVLRPPTMSYISSKYHLHIHDIAGFSSKNYAFSCCISKLAYSVTSCDTDICNYPV